MSGIAGVNFVYHASERRGISVFHPRRFWHSPDFTVSGGLAENQEAPPGASVLYAVFATTEYSLPFYFVPGGVRRIYLAKDKTADFDAGATLLNPDFPLSDRILILDEKERHRMEAHTFSVYAFDEAHFKRVSFTEYIAEKSVAPVTETVRQNALTAIADKAIHVHVVDDLGVTFENLQRAEVAFDA